MGVCVDNKKLIMQIRNGDIGAENTLILENQTLVHHLVRRCGYSNIEYEDLFQAGCIGLLKAARSFDFSYNVMFSTYAVPVILGEIRRLVRDDGIIKVSRSYKETAIKIMRSRKSLSNILGREPTTKEIANDIEMKVEDIILSLEAVAMPMSLDEKKSDDENMALENIIGNDTMEGEFNKMALKDALFSLPADERKIIMLRYFSDKTQTETAMELGVSQVKISRLEKKILSVLKSFID